MNTNETKDRQGAFQIDPPLEGVKGRGKRPAKPGMNKKITYPVIGVLFLAMVFIVVFQFFGRPDKSSEQEPLAPAVASPEQAPESSQPAMPEGEQSEAQGQIPEEPAQGQAEESSPGTVAQPVTPEEGQAASTPDPTPAPLVAETPAPKPEPAQEQPQEWSQPAPQEQAAPEAKPAAPPKVAEKPAVPAKKASSASKKAVDRNQLRNIKFKFTDTGKGVRLEISTANPVEHFKYFRLTDPPRMVVDLLGPFKEHAPQMNVPSNALVSSIRIGNHEDKLRIVADFKGKEPKSLDVTRFSDSEVRVIIEP